MYGVRLLCILSYVINIYQLWLVNSCMNKLLSSDLQKQCLFWDAKSSIMLVFRKLKISVTNPNKLNVLFNSFFTYQFFFQLKILRFRSWVYGGIISDSQELWRSPTEWRYNWNRSVHNVTTDYMPVRGMFYNLFKLICCLDSNSIKGYMIVD